MYRNEYLQRLVTVYGWILSLGSNLQSLFLLWMRLTWGHQFILAGLEKTTHIGKTIEFFISLRIPLPEFHAYAVSYGEVVCGSLLLIGFASRLASIPLVVIMIGALTTAHAHRLSDFRFLIQDPSALVHEAPYPYLITGLLVLIFGPGKISIDALIRRWVNKQPTY